MNGEARKPYLIEALLKEDDETVLSNVESLLIKTDSRPVEQKSFKDFAGIWTEEEAEKMKKDIKETSSNMKSFSFRDFAGVLTHEEALEMKRVIEESSEQIDPNEWK